MRKISTVGLFCCDKFEETPNEKVVNISKLTKSPTCLIIKSPKKDPFWTFSLVL